jgi:transcriptional regulator with PAS, ATPase and Fis domain
MVGGEHYCLSHHPWTCSAALIHDSSGQIIGCLDISGSVEEEHIHTLGIVTTTAKIIENQLVLMESYEMMHTAFNAIVDGLFVIDRNYAITRVNEKIAELFDIPEEKLLNYNMKEILKDLEITQKVFIRGETIRISDYAMNLKHKKLECLINISPIQLGNHITGAVVLVKEAHQVRKVVSQIVGFSAGYRFDDIITRDPKMLEAIEFAKKIALTDYTVLLQGESGTGKELFAHAIHNHSKRSQGPFIAINCAAMPKDLVESELFGYEKGAFTGAATEGKPGKFELANGGTIFLDEIGELPLEIQSKLLRIFDNQKVVRIGGQYERSLDTRIVCATNRNLRDEIEYRTFREDLFFRINVINVTLPPLRDRKGDIMLLAGEFLGGLNQSSTAESKGFTPEFEAALLQNPWKGNVRELRYFIQREYHKSDTHRIEARLQETPTRPVEVGDRGMDLKHHEKELIERALKAAKGNVVEASRKLSIGKSTVYRKIKSYRIDPHDYQ